MTDRYTESSGGRNYESLLYRRGWLLVEQEAGTACAPGHWARVETPAGWLVHDPDVQVVTARDENGRSVTVIGTLHLPVGNSFLLAPKTVGARLLEQLSIGQDAYQRALDGAYGRFVALRTEGDRVYLQQDALGLRQAFMTEPYLPRVVGSHENLVAAAAKATPGYFGTNNHAKTHSLFALPGQQTQYVGVVTMVPNTEVDLFTGRFHRINAVVRDLPQDLDQLLDAYVESVRMRFQAWTDSGGQFMLSLSAGLDSRTTLAILRPFAPDLLTFTYDLTYKQKNAANLHDTNGAVGLAELAGVEHCLLELPKMEGDRKFLAIMAANRWKPHSATVARAYLEQLPHDHVHIRSNGFEIVRRARTVHRFVEGEHLTADAMLAVASRGRSKDGPSRDAFQRYIDATHFPERRGEGIDPRDLFYWEYRMGVWLPHITAESDIAHDTDIVLNSRRWITALTLASYRIAQASQDRRALFYRLVERAWPELLDTEINGM